MILLLLYQPALATKTLVSEFDGSDWQSWTETKKFNFLTGFLLSSSYIVQKNEPMMTKDQHKSRLEEIRKRLSLREEKKRKKLQQISFTKDDVMLWGHYRASMVQNTLADYAVYEITVSQLAKGMDELYREPRNLKIRLADAVYVAKKQIKGANPKEMAELLLYLRGD